ncbi:hypothetical protein BKA65DRAFT_592497 [Rhexocercosporidium sp. MPI-PUGE-AT-0058]|nr:hypothetical protein BKA65DRAFT_592497 [Rhexocercosporidium sp. MPI-PUGE-AT-0058]
MQFSPVIIIAAAAVAPVFGQTGTAGSPNTTAVVTRTVTAYETYCPKSTTFTEGTKTYTATKEEWITVKNCPKKCTITYNPHKPTVVPVGEAPKYGNNTVPVVPVVPICPCPKGEQECPCENKPTAGTNPLTNGTDSGVPGTAGTPGNAGVPGDSGDNPAGTTPGSNGDNTGSNTGSDNGATGSDNNEGTLTTSAATTFVPGALLGLAAVAVYML